MKRSASLKEAIFLKSKVHFWTLEVLMVVGIIFICTKISFLFQPIGIFISTLFFPILIALFLYFIFNPVLIFLENKKYLEISDIAVISFYHNINCSWRWSSCSYDFTTANGLSKNMPGYIKEGKVYIQNYHIIGCLNGYLHKTTFPLKQLKKCD